MASPRSAGGVGGGGGGGGGSGGAAAGDDAIWSKLREAGFDEESLKRRDKAALIAYISRLESEVPTSLSLSPLLPSLCVLDGKVLGFLDLMV